MRFIELTFLCRITEPGSLSAYKGSMLRGAMGSALRRTCCTLRRPDCAGCLLGRTCPFPRLFTTGGDGPADHGRPTVYCVVPGTDGRTSCAAGDELAFRIRLFSYGTEYVPYFVHAVLLAGRLGIGPRTDRGQARFKLADVLADGRSVYDAEAERLTATEPTDLGIPVWRPSDDDGTVTVDLLTPCRFKRGNRFSDDMSFGELMRLVVRRMRSLLLLDGLEYRIDGFRTLMDAADGVRTISSSLAWKDWQRRSGRQHAVMQFGGVEGRLVFRGAIASFVPFLRLGELALIGKQTSFGLGQIRATVGGDVIEAARPAPLQDSA